MGFRKSGLGFVVIFFRPERGYSLERGGQKTAQKTIQKTAQKTTRKQREILEFLAKHPDASREEIASNLSGISESGVKYNLKALQTKGLLRRLGPDKGGRWEVTT